MTKFFTRIVTSLALTSAALSVPAFAAPVGEPQSVTVRYADLDLATDAGAKTLDRRIAYAAQKLYPDADTRDLRALAEVRTARAEAIAHAQPQIQTAMAAARSGKAYAANTVAVTAPGL